MEVLSVQEAALFGGLFKTVNWTLSGARETSLYFCSSTQHFTWMLFFLTGDICMYYSRHSLERKMVTKFVITLHASSDQVSYHWSPIIRQILHAFSDVNALEFLKRHVCICTSKRNYIHVFKVSFFFLTVLYDFSYMAEFKSSVLPSVFQNIVVC